MVRKHIYIRPGQQRPLKQLAKALGLSEAELVRTSLDQAAVPSAGIYRDRFPSAADLSLAFSLSV